MGKENFIFQYNFKSDENVTVTIYKTRVEITKPLGGAFKNKSKVNQVTLYINKLDGLECTPKLLAFITRNYLTVNSKLPINDSVSKNGYIIEYKSDQDYQMALRVIEVINEQIENLYS